jgi:hypothetical protein
VGNLDPQVFAARALPKARPIEIKGRDRTQPVNSSEMLIEGARAPLEMHRGKNYTHSSQPVIGDFPGQVAKIRCRVHSEGLNHTTCETFFLGLPGHRPSRSSLIEWATDFPVMAEGIDDASDAPAVLIADGKDLFCSGFDGAGKHGVRIGGRHNDADRDSAKRFWTEVVMLGRLVAEPEFGAVNGQLGNHAVATIESKSFLGSEGGLVEIDGARATSEAEPGSDCGWDGCFSFRTGFCRLLGYAFGFCLLLWHGLGQYFVAIESRFATG